MSNKKLESLPFEELLLKMEEVVNKLESDDATLEKSMDLFQEGMKLSKICSDKLKNVENKVTTLIEENENFTEETFEIDEE